MIELRSDTFTLPTPEMIQAIVSAPLGDDVWGEDPTVIALEEKSAHLFRKESAVLVSSGTMGNLLAMLSHTSRGDEVIVGDKSHVFTSEVAGSAVAGGIQLRTVSNTSRGTIDLNALQGAIRPVDVHYPRTALICLENSHNMCSGAVLDLEYVSAVRAIAVEAGAKLHMDGARIFNAAVALGVTAGELAAGADSVTFCLSKGLSAPVGSVLCGSEEFIMRARKYRKMLGGGMRQSGVIAAPGIVALDTMVDRLAEDHVHARRLGETLDALPGVSVDLTRLRTNIVVADVSKTGRSPTSIVEGLLKRGVKIAPTGPTTIRLVTHRNVSSEQIDGAVLAMQAELDDARVVPSA
jgi:threonine aldolase